MATGDDDCVCRPDSNDAPAQPPPPPPQPQQQPQQQPAETDNVYFAGGYTTRRFSVGGNDCQPFSATGRCACIQLETPIEVRFSVDVQQPFARALAASIVEFMQMNYGLVERQLRL